MAVKLTRGQMATLKSMVEIAEGFADQLYHIMRNHNLDLIDGCEISIHVEPANTICTKRIYIGRESTPFGEMTLMKGAIEREYSPVGKNSAEYELLFANEKVRSAMEKILHKEKPLPPDGLWVSVYDCFPDVVCGVSVNDSMAE